MFEFVKINVIKPEPLTTNEKRLASNSLKYQLVQTLPAIRSSYSNYNHFYRRLS